MKSVEIYYDISDIPEITDKSAFSGEALSFRNSAMELIEEAMLREQAGEWFGAEIGRTEVNFGFEVDDFDKAEKIIREAVAGTRYEKIREIERTELSAQDLQAFEVEAANLKPMTFFEGLGMLVFRRMPKRFREQ